MKNKTKFYRNNKDIFLKYFDNFYQYEALINAGNFVKMEEVIKEKTNFNLREFLNKIKQI
jgi:hypothetical protein